MKELLIKDIQFGKTDAYNELQEYGKKMFRKSFLEYDKYEINNFLQGKSYFICGDKGTGKTALLKYLECILSDDHENLVIPIRFKTEFDDDDKKAFKVVSTKNIKQEIIDNTDIGNYGDCVLLWQAYLINKILCCSDDGEYSLFEESKELSDIKKLLKSVYTENKNRLMPHITGGKAKVNASLLKGIDAELELEIDFNQNNQDVDFTKLSKLVLNLFSKLNYDKNPVYVIIDELELSVKSKEDNARDIILVRDLVIAVDRLNSICKKKYYDIHIMASIRNEVINSVESYGYEINKSIEDFGININWYQKNGDYKESPLLKLIENKIIASEEKHGITNHTDLWQKYFPISINNIEIRRYILRYTWFRPRDLIRMLKAVQTEANDAYRITPEMFECAMQLYAERSWNEIAEELRLTYDDTDIKAIKKILTNIEVPFTFDYLVDKSNQLAKIYDYVDSFSTKYKLIDVLEKLFDWGVIGNSGQQMVFKFLGYLDFSPTEKMIIHTPLRSFFGVKSRENLKLDIY